jgi:5,10-methylene-tetrahydrofolate dehydrogenase/methenyl tetrahydrofolate cyclohydrolase
MGRHAWASAILEDIFLYTHPSTTPTPPTLTQVGTATTRGRTALVAGASAGIGRELARLLDEEVATLINVARRQERMAT